MRLNGESASVEQRTIAGCVSCVGIGLHTGRDISLTLKPAQEDQGIVFVRTDLSSDQNLIPARFDLVTDTTLCTKITNSHGAEVGTIEHLMAAFNALGVDNIIVELDGPEVPIMDGSSAPFIFLIEAIGLKFLGAAKTYIKITAPIEIEVDGKTARLEPADDFEVAFTVDFDHPAIGVQSTSSLISRDTFVDELSRARTFGFLHEIEYMRSKGLARGGSLDNAVVLGPDSVLNEAGLRYDDEFARHKALDAVGDLYLAGARILGRFTGFKAGHQVNNMLLHTLFANPECWKWTTQAKAVVSNNVIDFPARMVSAPSTPPAELYAAPPTE